MKIRTVKKAIKALSEGRKTPLLRKVKLSNVTFYANSSDKKKP